MIRARRNVASLVGACLLAAGAFAAYHYYLRALMLDSGLRLGAVRPGNKVYRIVPLYIHWGPRVKTGLLLASAVIAAFIYWLRRWLTGRRLPFVLLLVAWQVAISLSVALIDGGPDKLWQPYDRYHKSDYIGAVERIDSPRQFLSEYHLLMPELPLHCRSHPPGGPLFLWGIAQLFGAGPIAASWATIVAASMSVPAVYLLAGEVLSEAQARVAAALFCLAPNVVCYSATCLDAVFMVPLVWTFFFLWRGRRERPIVYGVAGGVSVWAASMLSFSTSFVALWALVVLVITLLFDRTRLRNTALTLFMALATAAVCYALLFASSGYEPLAVLRQAFAGQDEIMKGRGHSSLRQSAHFAVANLIAFCFGSGLPIACLWARQTLDELRPATATAARWLLISFLLTLAIIDLAPLYTLETERIWIFLVGFLTIAAAARLGRQSDDLRNSPLLLATLLLQSAQTLFMEILFDWRW